jgi:NADH-quinone oxidoreductase subunit C
MSTVTQAAGPIGGRPVEGIEADILAQLQRQFGGKLLDAKVVRRLLVEIAVDRSDLIAVCRYLKEALGFEHLGCVSAVDWKDHYESVYHVENYSNGGVVQVNARIPHDDPKIASVCGLWNAANYHEREAWDLMGIVYEGHPNLERILLPKDFKFFPLRKDFPQEVDRQYISRRKLKGGK